MSNSLRALPILLSSLPSAEEIRRKAEEVVARPPYQLESQLDPESLSLWLRLLMWVLKPFRWFFQSLEGLPDVARWAIVLLLTVLLVALITHIVWTFISAVRGTPRRRYVSESRIQEQTPEEIERTAVAAAAAGDFIAAVRLLFLAALRGIERVEKRKLRRGITNRELLRRYRASPLSDPLRELVETIELKWYGHEVCREVDFVRCRDEYARVCQLLSANNEASKPETTRSPSLLSERNRDAVRP